MQMGSYSVRKLSIPPYVDITPHSFTTSFSQILKPLHHPSSLWEEGVAKSASLPSEQTQA